MRKSLFGLAALACAASASAQTPAIDGVMNSGSLVQGPVCPGLVVYIFGRELGPSAQVCTPTAGAFPTSCAGVSVAVGNRNAAITFVSPTQVVAQLPTELNLGEASIVVERSVAGQLARSAPASVRVERYSPALMREGSTSRAVSLKPDGSVNSPQNPVLPGDLLKVYAVGLGATTPPVPTGSIPAGVARVNGNVRVVLGTEFAEVRSAAASLISAGLYEVDVRVPPSTAAGEAPIALTIDGVVSQRGLTVSVGVPKPTISSAQNTASPDKVFTPGSWISIYGTGLATASRIWGAADFTGKRLPTTLDGVSVKVNGLPASVYYVSPTQVNALAPADSRTGEVTVELTNNNGTASTKAILATAAPAFFTFEPGGAKYLAAVYPDGTYAGPLGLFGSAAAVRPVKPGDIVSLFGTGFGATVPAAPSDEVLDRVYPLADPDALRVTVGGVPARVDFIGIVSTGQFQLNVVVPDVPTGDAEVIASMGTATSPKGKYLAIQR